LIIDKNLDLDSRVELELYRIAQEALNNTIKHSNSKSVILSLKKDGEIITLEITDDGCGFDYTNRGYNGGLGIRSMSERAKVIGGKLSIDSQPGCGTRVRITVGG
jgi:two-component system sensor histidine kinase NreB